jgi:hypothetical protein
MTPYDVRTRIVEALETDLVGPFVAEGHHEAGVEVLPLAPSHWYLTGFLAQQADSAPDVDDPDAQGDLPAGSESQAEDAGSAEPDSKRRQHFPASMGLSVFLPPKGNPPRATVHGWGPMGMPAPRLSCTRRRARGSARRPPRHLSPSR